jgi:hypothetical protein
MRPGVTSFPYFRIYKFSCHEVYFFKEYEITNGDQKINFVAGEFVNSKVGIYIKDDLSDGKL